MISYLDICVEFFEFSDFSKEHECSVPNVLLHKTYLYVIALQTISLCFRTRTSRVNNNGNINITIITKK